MTDEVQPVQLRIGFQTPTVPVAINVCLSGLSVLVEPAPGRFDETWQYLSACGITATVDENRGLVFPVTALARLADLPDQVRVDSDMALRPLVQLVLNPSSDGLPATLSVDPMSSLRLGWFDGSGYWDEELDPSAAAALLSSDLPFVATAEAWELLKGSSSLPVLAGRARSNLDGYVEITTTKPQLVETAPLPGLFRIDETHFGVALAFADSIDDAPGFVWDGRRPTRERGPERLPDLGVELSAHATDDLRDMVEQLSAYRAQAVVWESGLGRRVFALATVEALDAWPLLIVTPPSGIWVWQRHLDLLGRSHALTHDRADAHIITYRDLASRSGVSSPTAIIFDDLASPEATASSARAGLHRLDGVLDAYRIAISSSWPEDLADAMEIMAVLRPGEFRADVPLTQRYPVRTDDRASEHIEVYLSRRSAADPGTERPAFRRSSVVTVPPSETQLRALAEILERSRGANPASVLAESLEVVSAGPAHATSPKVAAVVTRVRAAAAAGRRVVVLTRHRRTATLVSASLRPLPVRQVDASEGDAGLDAALASDVAAVVVRFERGVPNLRAFDEVVVVDYPWSMETLEQAVGSSSAQHGPRTVTCLHAEGTLDDRLALMSACRRELQGVIDPDAMPTPEEISYLLQPRWVSG